MTPPSTGRNNICGRFTRHLNVICIDTFDDVILDKIFGSIMTWHFSSQEDETIQRLSKVSSESVDVNNWLWCITQILQQFKGHPVYIFAYIVNFHSTFGISISCDLLI